jgi:hypothetical protein
MALEHYLGIGCIVIVLSFIIYKVLTRGQTLEDIYKEIDKKKEDENT